MSYANGRVYTEVVGSQQVGVSIYDVQRALQTGIVTDVKGLCAHQNVNPWARYKPIPCTYNMAQNHPTPLTLAERAAENWGIQCPIDMFAADTDQQYSDFAMMVFPTEVSAIPNNSIRKKTWSVADVEYARLTDFTKQDRYAAKVDNIGYDHNAECDNVLVHHAGSTYHLQPLIPENQRYLVIPVGTTNARFQFPNDNIWLKWYFDKVYGEDQYGVTLTQNEEWLSPIDFVGSNAYNRLVEATTIRRSVVILKWMNVTGQGNRWWPVARVVDSVGGNSEDRPFDTNKGAYLDLTDTSNDVNRVWGTEHLKDMTGTYVFLETWHLANDSTSITPIYGYTYKVTIDRSSVDINVDIAGLLEFDIIGIDLANGEAVLYGHVAYSEVTTLGESDDVKRVFAANYDMLQIAIGTDTVNLLDNTLEHYLSNDDSMAKFEIVIPNLTISTMPATANIMAIRKNTGITQTKQINTEAL